MMHTSLVVVDKSDSRAHKTRPLGRTTKGLFSRNNPVQPSEVTYCPSDQPLGLGNVGKCIHYNWDTIKALVSHTRPGELLLFWELKLLPNQVLCSRQAAFSSLCVWQRPLSPASVRAVEPAPSLVLDLEDQLLKQWTSKDVQHPQHPRTSRWAQRHASFRPVLSRWESFHSPGMKAVLRDEDRKCFPSASVKQTVLKSESIHFLFTYRAKWTAYLLSVALYVGLGWFPVIKRLRNKGGSYLAHLQWDARVSTNIWMEKWESVCAGGRSLRWKLCFLHLCALVYWGQTELAEAQ